jgi:hypothetical protein
MKLYMELCSKNLVKSRGFGIYSILSSLVLNSFKIHGERFPAACQSKSEIYPSFPFAMFAFFLDYKILIAYGYVLALIVQ